ncbi:DUF202 domain-containing protein [Nonomuraea rubra]
MGAGFRSDPALVPEGDCGLARERTQLAWTRTTVSLIALGTSAIKAPLTQAVRITSRAARSPGEGPRYGAARSGR